ncbi:hypothetical protein HK100_001977 [Physocladia obscura]|uniref:Uncharacterized protein n=1 Tax=Physocladia obscura TaxID=109957 RepID=A0AAD5XAM9_9FUNG|nr:hypothetical protein HK100_001977 [Physocladia obscura]
MSARDHHQHSNQQQQQQQQQQKHQDYHQINSPAMSPFSAPGQMSPFSPTLPVSAPTSPHSEHLNFTQMPPEMAARSLSKLLPSWMPSMFQTHPAHNSEEISTVNQTYPSAIFPAAETTILRSTAPVLPEVPKKNDAGGFMRAGLKGLGIWNDK